MLFGAINTSHSPGLKSQDCLKLARTICAGDEKALSSFLLKFSDHLYYVAARFNNRGISRDYWEYKTGKGKTIRVNDDVADSYLWLVEIARRKSCAYRGDSGATFATYITSVLNSDFTFKDWLRWKTGVTSYVPRCIKHLGTQHIQVFKLLRQKKIDEDICYKLKLDYYDYIQIFEEIESALVHTNQNDLLDTPSFISTDQYDDSVAEGFDIEDKAQLDPSRLLEVEQFRSFLDAVVSKLITSERRLLLLYWAQGLSIEEIFDLLTRDEYNEYLKELSIETPQKIYRRIDLLTRKCLRIASAEFPAMIESHKITTSAMRRLLRLYYSDWQSDE